MGVLTEYGTIRDVTSGSTSNIAYVLNNNHDFSLTEYKVLLSQNHTGFIKCMQMLYNGKIELYYLTSEHRTFTSMLPELDGNGFMTVVANLLNAIIEVKNNGFLSYQKIDISLDKIFIHPSNLSVGLIYVPINVRVLKDFSAFETELRTNLVKLINSLPSLNSQRISDFYVELSNGRLSLEELASKITGISPNLKREAGSTRNSPNLKREAGTARDSGMTLEALNAPVALKLNVNKDSYVIGKNHSEVDGVISFNSAISRAHCKITRINGNYWLEDLGSTNGTYINKVRLQPNKSRPIKNGDRIQLANIDFHVRVL
ncbi:FHA domain-containing protein [Niallia sp. Krafla_26]|uniref:FHA domain-containing protein n=1 Tax=Niallia sp. Krafla_26 TaxID=3064703 RepID=UPI003D16E11B